MGEWVLNSSPDPLGFSFYSPPGAARHPVMVADSKFALRTLRRLILLQPFSSKNGKKNCPLMF